LCCRILFCPPAVYFVLPRAISFFCQDIFAFLDPCELSVLLILCILNSSLPCVMCVPCSWTWFYPPLLWTLLCITMSYHCWWFHLSMITQHHIVLFSWFPTPWMSCLPALSIGPSWLHTLLACCSCTWISPVVPSSLLHFLVSYMGPPLILY
jgi:hypothetical protein